MQSNLMMYVKFPIRIEPVWEVQPNPFYGERKPMPNSGTTYMLTILLSCNVIKQNKTIKIRCISGLFIFAAKTVRRWFMVLGQNKWLFTTALHYREVHAGIQTEILRLKLNFMAFTHVIQFMSLNGI